MEKRNEFLNANEDVVSKVLENQPDDEYLYDLADLFKTFGDSTRIKILYALFEGKIWHSRRSGHRRSSDRY